QETDGVYSTDLVRFLMAKKAHDADIMKIAYYQATINYAQNIGRVSGLLIGAKARTRSRVIVAVICSTQATALNVNIAKVAEISKRGNHVINAIANIDADCKLKSDVS